MALTVSISETTVVGNKRMTRGTLAFDASYPTGGESLVARDVGLGAIDHIEVDPKSGYTFQYDYTNSKLLAYVPPAQTHAHDLKAIGGQAAAGTAALAYYATDILGKEAATNVTFAKADSATKGGVLSETLAAAAQTEVANATDLSAVTGVRFNAFGY